MRKDFSDPIIVDCLQKPFSYIKDGKEDDLLSMYFDAEDYIYCFNEDHACLAIPYCKIVDTGNKIFSKGISVAIPSNLSSHVKSFGYKGTPHPIDFITCGCS